MGSSLIQEGGYDIRFSATSEEPFVKKWLLDEATRLWYPPSSDVDVDVFVRNWVGFSRHKSSLTATYHGETIGVGTLFLMPYIKVSHLCMFYMVVAPEYQRKGVGGSLLRNLKHLAKTRFRLESMHCEVFEGSPIIGLLEKNGFEEVVQQENFVKFPECFKARIILETQL
jgi:ribosomal protein S18 acetylase RimI-like enzyme